MMIAVDGPDHSGKTTLAKYLVDNMPNARDKHLTYRWPGSEHLYNLAAFKWMWTHGRHNYSIGNAVLDRWWMSEEIYSKAYRRGTRYYGFHRQLDNMFGSLFGVYVLCLPSDKGWCLDGHATRAAAGVEMFDDNEKVYDLFMHRGKYEWANQCRELIIYDPCTQTPKQILDEIKYMIHPATQDETIHWKDLL
jgi:hypothetical protein